MVSQQHGCKKELILFSHDPKHFVYLSSAHNISRNPHSICITSICYTVGIGMRFLADLVDLQISHVTLCCFYVTQFFFLRADVLFGVNVTMHHNEAGGYFKTSKKFPRRPFQGPNRDCLRGFWIGYVRGETCVNLFNKYNIMQVLF